MRGMISFFLILLFSTPCFASNKSISITVKPSAGLSGTTSFNIHQDGKFAVLLYKNPTKIAEKTMSLESKRIKEIDSLAHEVLKEVTSTKDYSIAPK